MADTYNRELLEGKTAKCKRCNSKDVAWHQSSKGKWYLIEVFVNDRGYEIASYRDFHSTYCGKPELHATEQNEINQAGQEKAEATEQARQAREQAKADAEQELRDEVISMTTVQRLIFEKREQDKLAALKKDWVSMDVMSEHMRWLAECAEQERRVEIIAVTINETPPKF